MNRVLPKTSSDGGPELVFFVILIVGLALSALVQRNQSHTPQTATQVATEKATPDSAVLATVK